MQLQCAAPASHTDAVSLLRTGREGQTPPSLVAHLVQNTRIILLPPTPPLSLSCLKGFKSKQKHEQTKLKSWQKNSRLDTATAQEIRTPKLPAAPNAEHGQGRRKEEALGLSLQSVTESVDQFTAAAAHRRTSFWAVTELLSPLAAERSQPGSGKWMHRTSTLTSRKTQDNGMQTANFYQFNCALRLAVKSPLEKYHPGVSNQKVLIFFFYIYHTTFLFNCQSSQRVQEGGHPHLFLGPSQFLLPVSPLRFPRLAFQSHLLQIRVPSQPLWSSAAALWPLTVKKLKLNSSLPTAPQSLLGFPAAVPGLGEQGKEQSAHNIS